MEISSNKDLEKIEKPDIIVNRSDKEILSNIEPSKAVQPIQKYKSYSNTFLKI